MIQVALQEITFARFGKSSPPKMRSPPAREALEGRLPLGELRDSHREIFLIMAATGGAKSAWLQRRVLFNSSIKMEDLDWVGSWRLGGRLQSVSGDFVQD